MNYFFTIQVSCVNDSFSASALGEQGEWSRGLNTALEALLNKLLAKGIFNTIVADRPDEQNKEIAPDVEGRGSFGSVAFGEDEPAPSKKTHKTKHDP